jgi:hypothetical protein
MAEKQKPQTRIVKVAAKALKHPETATRKEIQQMAARILDDQKNDPEPHQPVTSGGAKQVMRYLSR